jgi:hypothetical protein
MVIAVQFGGNSGADETSEPKPVAMAPAPQPAREPAGTADAGREPPPAVETPRPWPEWKLVDVLKHDPFATPPLLQRSDPSDGNLQNRRDAEAAARREEIARKKAEREQHARQLMQEGVQALVGSARNGHAAVVGSETLGVGDVLGEFRVIGIEPDGVVLQPLELQ